MVLALVAVLFTPAEVSAASGSTTRVSVDSNGTGADQASVSSAVSGDGRVVAFESAATNLVAGDTNKQSDVFVHDRQTGATERVSVASDGTEPNSRSTAPALSSNGRFVAFQSAADNLVPGDANGRNDVFVHDRKTGTTTRVSVTSSGGEGSNESPFGGGAGSVAPDISGDGRYVSFTSHLDFEGDEDLIFDDIFVHDRQTGTTSKVSVPSAGAPSDQAAGASSDSAISADGRFVAFESEAPNLVDGDTNGGTPFNSSAGRDIFVHDRTSGATTRVNVASGGTQSNATSFRPAISAGGGHVAFLSSATNLVTGDTNGRDDVFVHDRQTGATSRVSVASGGIEANGYSNSTAISGDGSRVAFHSDATNLVPGDTNGTDDIFVHDRQAGSTTRVNVADDGGQAVGRPSFAAPDISDDGRNVTFDNDASNLVRGDTNGTYDVFVRDALGVPAPPSTLVAVGDVVVYEGDAGTRAAVFTVSLYEPSATTVSVRYATADGTASAGGDYKAKSGILSFSPGVTGLTVKVPVLADGVDETVETFGLALSKPSGTVIADSSGGARIIDDDPATTTGRRLAIGDVSVYEGDAGTRVAVFNVSLSTPASSPVTVSYATADGSATAPSDYIAKAGTLSFAPGTTSLPIKVTINADADAEGPCRNFPCRPSESFTVVLSGLSGAKTAIFDGTGLATIFDDEL